NDDSNGNFDIKSAVTKYTTGSIENTEDDEKLINEDTSSENYKFINDNETELTEDDKSLINDKGNDKFWADYHNLDRYGRVGEVTALVTHDSVNNHSYKVQERTSFSSN